MEIENPANETTGKVKQWTQDNLRIILSILIVIAIAGGIYSYSKRTEAPSIDQTIVQQNEESNSENSEATEKTATENEKVQVAESQETENSFIETAGPGDGTTRLARRALANYLEKNADSSLTAEHKIYIEDYLRKNVPQKRIYVGTSVEFSKDLIQNAIAKAKTLNDKQLQNLHKYAVRVPSLS